MEKEVLREIKVTCIFEGKPPECSVCLNSLKLHCLSEHQHLLVSESGKKDLRIILEKEMNSSIRYKTVSGEEQRPKDLPRGDLYNRP